MNRKRIPYAASLLILFLLLVSCTTLPDEAGTIPFTHLSLKAETELLDMRVYLYHSQSIRSSTSHDVDNTTGRIERISSTSSKDTLPHALCISVTDSIFIDLNGNVFLSVLDYYDLEDADSWEIDYAVEELSGHRTAILSDGEVRYENHKEVMNIDDWVRISKSEMERKSGTRSRRIVKEGNRLSYESNLGFLEPSVTLTTLGEDELQFGKTTIEQKGNEIIFEHPVAGISLRIVNNENVLEIYEVNTFLLAFGYERLISRIYKTGNGYAALNSTSLGKQRIPVRIEGNRIESKRGMLETWFEILEP